MKANCRGSINFIRLIRYALVSFVVFTIIVLQMWWRTNTIDYDNNFVPASCYNINIEKEHKSNVKLLTLATTFSDSIENEYIYRNTVVNLGLLTPHIQPVLFIERNQSNSLANFALANGWIILQLRRTHKMGLPFLKDMLTDIQQKHNSTFYGYVNGDILFDQCILATLIAVKQYLKYDHNILITGRRINYKMRGENIRKLEVVLQLSLKGTLFSPDAGDYFITPYHGYPWSVLKDVVIGKPAYDNYVIAMGIQNNVTVIDATKTVTALHQTGRDGNFAGQGQHHEVNTEIIGKFNYSKGLTSCAQWFTDVDVLGKIYCFKRRRSC